MSSFFKIFQWLLVRWKGINFYSMIKKYEGIQTNLFINRLHREKVQYFLLKANTFIPITTRISWKITSKWPFKWWWLSFNHKLGCSNSQWYYNQAKKDLEFWRTFSVCFYYWRLVNVNTFQPHYKSLIHFAKCRSHGGG